MGTERSWVGAGQIGAVAHGGCLRLGAVSRFIFCCCSKAHYSILIQKTRHPNPTLYLTVKETSDLHFHFPSRFPFTFGFRVKQAAHRQQEVLEGPGGERRVASDDMAAKKFSFSLTIWKKCR